MNEYEFERLKSTRNSRWYYLDDAEEPRLREKLASNFLEDGFYVGMFRDDVSHMLPFSRGLDDGFEVTLDPSNPRTNELVRLALPGDYGPPRVLSDGLRVFVTRAANWIVTGPVYFEIDYLYDGEPGGQPTAFKLEEILPGSVGAVDGGTVQFVPAALSDLSTPEGLHYVRLADDNLVVVRAPKDIAPQVARAIDTYVAAGRQQGVPTSMLTTQVGQGVGFDHAVHRAMLAREVLSATHRIGWDGRGLFTKGLLLDPYIVWLHLQFVRLQIRLRNVILEGLQQAIGRAGEVLGFDVRLRISGLRTLADIDAAEADLRAGARSLTELNGITP